MSMISGSYLFSIKFYAQILQHISNLKDGISEKESNESSALSYVGQECVGPELLSHKHLGVEVKIKIFGFVSSPLQVDSNIVMVVGHLLSIGLNVVVGVVGAGGHEEIILSPHVGRKSSS